MLIARYDEPCVRGERRRQEHLIIRILAHVLVERWGIDQQGVHRERREQRLERTPSGSRSLLSASPTRRYASRIGGEMTRRMAPVLHAVRIRPGTPRKSSPDTKTLVSSTTFTWRVAPF